MNRMRPGKLLAAAVTAAALAVSGCAAPPSQPSTPQPPPSLPPVPMPPSQSQTQAPSPSAAQQAPPAESAAGTPAAAQGQAVSGGETEGAPNRASQSGAAEPSGASDEEVLARAIEDLERGRGAPGAAAPPPEGAAGAAGRQGAGSAAPSTAAGTAPAAGGAGAGSGARTDRERVAALDARLDDQLKEFDGAMLREREGAIQRDNEHGASGAGRGAGGDGEGELAGDGYGAGGEEPVFPVREPPPLPSRGRGNDSGQGNMPDLPGATRQGDEQSTVAAAPVPEDVADVRDDDIVARQLREAAMRETDPELREKLWDEYRKYKRELRSR